MTNRSFSERDREDEKGRELDNPDLVKTDKESLFDMHEDMQNVDPIPVEELSENMKDERNHEKTKDHSSSDDRYPD